MLTAPTSRSGGTRRLITFENEHVVFGRDLEKGST